MLSDVHLHKKIYYNDRQIGFFSTNYQLVGQRLGHVTVLVEPELSHMNFFRKYFRNFSKIFLRFFGIFCRHFFFEIFLKIFFFLVKILNLEIFRNKSIYIYFDLLFLKVELEKNSLNYRYVECDQTWPHFVKQSGT